MPKNGRGSVKCPEIRQGSADGTGLVGLKSQPHAAEQRPACKKVILAASAGLGDREIDCPSSTPLRIHASGSLLSQFPKLLILLLIRFE